LDLSHQRCFQGRSLRVHGNRIEVLLDVSASALLLSGVGVGSDGGSSGEDRGGVRSDTASSRNRVVSIRRAW
jgi:hypothetical protein